MIRAEDCWWVLIGALVVVFGVTIMLWWFDPRQLAGSSVWAKPLKFQASLALHFATLVLIVAALSEGWRAGSFLAWVAIAATAATLFEIAYIMLQAGQQRHSHFNLSTPASAALYTAMAIGAVAIVLAAGIVGVVAWLDAGVRFGPATRLAVALGLVGGTILTLIVAFRMGGALTHHVGVEAPGGARMPVTGWSLAVGDRRVPHFFATHMIQVVPAVGLLADMALPRLAALMVAGAAAVGWAALTWALFAQANAGLPIWRE